MQRGGDIVKNHVLSKILSIGFELESGQVAPAHMEAGQYVIPNAVELPLQTESENITFVQSFDTMTDGIQTKLVKFSQSLPSLDPFIDLGGRYQLVNIAHQNADDVQYLVHTEFIMTFTLPPISDNIILTHFYYMLEQVKLLLNRPHNTHTVPDSQVKIIDYGSDQPAYIVVSNANDILDTQWVPQCTIRLSISDIPHVIDYIAVGNYKQQVTAHYQTLIQDIPNPTDIDRGFTYLGAMFLTNSLKTSPFTIRHSWAEIARNWDKNGWIKNKDLHQDIIFHDVRQFPLESSGLDMDYFAMIELRTIKPQLQSLIGSKALTINNMLHGISAYFGGQVPEKDHPVSGAQLMMDKLLDESDDI